MPIAEGAPVSTREYQLNDTQYAVVVAQKGGMSKEEAKKIALKRAAELTVRQGNRYFVVVKEEEVWILETATKTDGQDYHPDIPDSSQYPPPNLYEEIIQRKDTRRDGIISWESTNAEKYPGLRLIIQMYMENPGKGYDACTFTSCEK